MNSEGLRLLSVTLAFLIGLTLIGCSGKKSPDAETAAPSVEIPSEDELFTHNDLTPADLSEAETLTLSENLTIDRAGVYRLSGNMIGGQILVDAEKTDKIFLILDGVALSTEKQAAIYVRSADKVFLTLADGSENSITVTGEIAAGGETKVDAAIFSKDDLTLNGSGSLTVTSSGNGITSKDDLVIAGGKLNISADGHALEGKDSVRIANGEFVLSAGKDAIHADNDEEDTLGNCYLAGGDLTLSAKDDAVHASGNLFCLGGKLRITECYEGLEGKYVSVSGGDITIVASDDGINAAGGRDQSGFGGPGGRRDNFGGGDPFGGGGEPFGGGGDPFGSGGEPFGSSSDVGIEISGGKIVVNAAGDGVDSNGFLTVSGGELYISGPINSANGAIDYETAGTVTGGKVVAVGAVGMAMNFGNASTQCTAMINLNGKAGEILSVSDADGKLLLSFAPEKDYQNVVISSPDFKLGETYTVTAGEASATVTFTQTVIGDNRSGPGGFDPRGNRDPGKDRPNDPGQGGFDRREPPDQPPMPESGFHF